VEKARSLIDEANLDDVEDGFHGSDRADGVSQHSDPGERSASGPAAPSGFAPASASQSGFSPAGGGRSEPSGLHPRPASSLESGVFSGQPGTLPGGRLVESLQGALSAASRNEAGLGSLQRAIRDASRAFTASRQAQESLTEELRVMYRGLNDLMSEKAAVERYAALLTQERDAALDAAEDARREAKRERDFLLREQDRFIQLLLEEHEAELHQVRRSLGQAPVPSREQTSASSPNTQVSPVGHSLEASHAPSLDSRKIGDAEEAPRLSGAALARQALANSAGSSAGLEERTDERAPTYPPAPAVLDLEALAAEVDGNSERPPPIRRIGVVEALHLKPARVPTQLFDTLVSPVGELDPNRKG
jgi:hypothetical protein